MKQIFFAIAFISIILSSCSSGTSKKSNIKDKSPKESIKVVLVDSILATPEKYLEKTVSIQGLVIHTCKHSGKKMFLAGADKNRFVKVIAGNSISIFGKELEGETVIATGKITIMEKSDEKHKDQDKKEEHKEHDEKTTSKDSTSGEGCATETKIKRYEMTCDSYSVVK